MTMIAFNNFGFDHLPEARPYVEKGIEGQAQAAHDLGFHAFQLNLRPPQDTAFFERVDVPRLRRKLEELAVEISAHHHAFMPKPVLPHFLQRGEWYAGFLAYSGAALRFIHELGGRLLTIHPPQTDDRNLDQDSFTEEECRLARQNFEEAVRELGALADTLDMRLGIEAICFPPPFPRATVYRSTQELDDFLRSPGLPDSVGLQPDVTHFHHKGLDFNQVLRHWSDRIWEEQP